MERYALVRHLQRQRQFVRRVVPGQRLSAYVAQHRLLPAVIGPMSEPATPVAQSWSAAPAKEARVVQPVDAAQPSLEEVGQEVWPAPAQELRQRPNVVTPHPAAVPVYPPVQAEESLEANASVAAQTEADEAKAHTRRPEQPGAEFVLPASVPPEQTLDASEGRHAAPQKNEQLPDQHSKLNRRKARIEERPQPAPHASTTDQMQTSAEMSQHAEAAHPMTKAEPEAEAQKRAESDAAALFTSGTPDRSPQEWFALLTQAERKQQPDRRVQATSQAGHELRSTPSANAVQPEPAARLVPSANATQPESKTRLRQPISAARPVIYAEGEPQRAQSASPLNASERAALPSLPASLLGARNAVQFVPALQTASDQSGENMGNAGVETNDRSVAEPLSMRARQVLKPLVGFDPADARIHRNPAAARFASTQRADAVTVGDDIYLAAEHANNEPETLGLLAHELTHVARHHEPRAVPPVLSSHHASATEVQGGPVSKRDEEVSDETLATADEEALAEQVERQVTQRAREAAEAPGHAASPTSAEQTFTAQNTRADRPQQPQEKQNSWGSLPAPWEPLPDWLAPSSSTPASGTEAFASLPQMQQPLPVSTERSDGGQQSVAGASAPNSTGNAQSAPAAQRAGRERSRATTEEQAHWPAPPAQQREPEPDLDKLARQVYAVLKRKLEVERRRMS